MVSTVDFDKYLIVSSPTKKWVKDKVIYLLTTGSSIPSFSAAAQKLSYMTQNPKTSIEEISAVISMDPGLATRCVGVASSAFYGARSIESIDQALMMIGLEEVRRIAFTVGVMDSFSHLRIKIDWDRFWMHSILVARLSHKMAGAFRECSGAEYLSGLVHDIGKLFIEHYFPREFEQIIMKSLERRCGHSKIEKEVLGIDHTQIGAAVCELLKLDTQIINAVWSHHDPLNPMIPEEPVEAGSFLPACVAVGDALANMGQISLGGEKIIDTPFQSLPEWVFLNSFEMVYGLELDLQKEINEADDDLKAFK